MKKIQNIQRIICIVMMAGLMAGITSCKKTDWDDPMQQESPYGNNKLDEKTAKIISIAELKAKFAANISTQYSLAEVKEDIYIKGVVTGNDLGGNMYSEISMQDDSGAITICISQSGLWGYLPLGQEILVALKGLSVGNYGYHPEIGTPYTSSSKSSSSYGKTYVSRMDPTIWHQHFKILGMNTRKYYEYSNTAFDTSWNVEKVAGQVATLYNVSFKLGGKATYFDLNNYKTDNSSTWNTSRYFNELPSSVFIYTSRYAKFAADTLPAGKVNVTGVIKRYNSNFEFIIISVDDVVKVK